MVRYCIWYPLQVDCVRQCLSFPVCADYLLNLPYHLADLLFRFLSTHPSTVLEYSYLYGAEEKVAIYGTGILKSQGTLGGVLVKDK